MSHPKRTTDRGQMTPQRAIGLAVALMVAGILAGVVLPVAIDSIHGTTDASFTGVSEGDTNEVTSTLNVTLDNNAGSGTNISVTLTDTDSSNTLSLTNISQGNTQNGTLEGETLKVTADSVDSSSADFTVNYPNDYNYGSGAKSLWNIIDLILVLAVFLFLIGLALLRSDLM